RRCSPTQRGSDAGSVHDHSSTNRTGLTLGPPVAVTRAGSGIGGDAAFQARGVRADTSDSV
ncbi:MAG TPA: hypothetical protein VG405_00805, partial [Solirubrobacteraceae bacterium]|nr:hypothetical protein [Solirubrobacteraceae bacterium]